ncbi:MAG: redox-regulated ATPase YchF [Gemmatimonadota bacterium]
MLNVGIVGLPNVGKSSLFNALTAAGAPSENYPFCTVEPNVGTVAVPDERLDRIHGVSESKERTPTFIHFVDIAGLVEGASEGEGLGNQFLGQIREVHAIAHVLRCFEDPDVAHVSGSVDPVRDREVVETELALADLATVERRLERIEKKARSGEQDARKELAVLQKTHAVLAEGDPVRSVELADHEARWIRGLHLLTSKPVLYVANVGEEDLPGGEEENEHVRALEEAVEAEGGGEEAEIVTVCTKIESELAELEPEERKAFLEELGLERSGLERLINAAYRLLGLITFFTTGPKETRAWTVRSGATAPEAAGQIHTDFQRGFIRAETISFDELMEAGSMKAARERGLIRAEGRDYEVRDGDVILFRFNV